MIIVRDQRLLASQLYTVSGTWPWTCYAQPCHYNMIGDILCYILDTYNIEVDQDIYSFTAD